MATKSFHNTVLILIIVLAIFFRFWQITSTPPGLYPDEAMNGVNALDSLKTGDFKVFYPDNNGREGMIVWLDAMTIKILGARAWALRVPTALAGVFAVLGLYFLLKELFDRRIALASSFFMAVGFWAVLFSRIGFRANLMMPFLIWSFYFLNRGLTQTDAQTNAEDFPRESASNPRFSAFIIGGILFGLGFYTYVAFRFAPILALLVFLPILIIRNNKKFWIGALIFAVAAFIIALPIGMYFIQHPDDFFGRVGQISVFSETAPIKTILTNFAKTFGMFNIQGDYNWRHNFSGSPQLFWPVGALFLLGIYLGIKRFNFPNKFLFAWSLVFLFPVILSSEGLPHALRALALAPVAYAFAGIGAIWLYDLVRVKKGVFVLSLFFLLATVGFEFNKYFVYWAHDPQVANAYSENYVKEAEYLNKYPPTTKKYVIMNASGVTARGLPMPAMTSLFLTYDNGPINYLRADDWGQIVLGDRETVIVPLQYDRALLMNLRKKFPQAKIDTINTNAFALIIH